MEELKKIKKFGFLTSLVYLLFGLLLLLWPDISFLIICNVIGILCIVAGLAQIILYFSRDSSVSLFRNDFATGLIMLVIGVVLLSSSGTIIAVLPIILGIFILVSGAFKLQSALDLWQLKFEYWWGVLLLAAVSAVTGAVMIWDPFQTDESLVLYVGICFVADGISGMITQFLFGRKVRAYFNELEKPEQDGERTGRQRRTAEKTKKDKNAAGDPDDSANGDGESRYSEENEDTETQERENGEEIGE